MTKSVIELNAYLDCVQRLVVIVVLVVIHTAPSSVWCGLGTSACCGLWHGRYFLGAQRIWHVALRTEVARYADSDNLVSESYVASSYIHILNRVRGSDDSAVIDRLGATNTGIGPLDGKWCMRE